MDFNKNWKFLLEDLPDEQSPSAIGGHLLDLDETDFRTVDVPHDYSMEQSYHKEADGCTGYFLGGMGWYRKHFTTTADMKDKKVFVCFDGIYNRSNIYINEHFVAFHPFGYSPCLIDITDYLNDSGDNVLAVKVDHTRYADSRWYTGSGIYRKVELHIMPKTYIPLWGFKVATPTVTDEKASVQIDIELQNEVEIKDVTISTKITDPKGVVVASLSDNLSVENSANLTQNVEIANPILWGIYQGNQYTIDTCVIVDGEVIQEKQTKFGLRYFHFDVNEGFFLNGKNELIKGACLHHDAGLVGSAIPLDVWRRRLETLVEAGTNAIRTAHNPASSDFLNLCDEMGLLVQEEFYDEWDNPKDKRYNAKSKRVDYITLGHHEFFQEYAQKDLQVVIDRDFNHPCIFQWSIGNEIEWTYPKYNNATGYFGADASGGYFQTLPPYSKEEIRRRARSLAKDKYEVGETAQKLAKWTKEKDTSRPVIANCILPSASFESGYTDALDIVGFSYRRVVYDRLHNDYPEKIIMGTENVAQWHEWKAVIERPFISGIFLWAGIDYLGESGNDDRWAWPRKASQAGILDVAGFKRGSFYMMKTLWVDTPSIHMETQTLDKSLYNLENDCLVEKIENGWQKYLWIWQDVNEYWNYNDGETIVIEVYSNCDSVTLFLNDEEISTKHLADFEDRIYKWHIPYVAGKLVAVGTKGDVTETTTLQTAGKAYSVKLTADKTVIENNFDSVVHFTADLVDESGNYVKYEESEVEFIIDGEARVFGVDNGNNSFVGEHNSTQIITSKGKALMILGGVQSGEVKVSAKVCGKDTISNKVVVTVK